MSKISTQRVLAFIIDSILISLLNSLITSLFEIESYEIYSFELFNRNWVLSNNLYLFVLIIYFVLFDIINNGNSIGKSIFKLKVLTTNYQLSKSTLIKRSVLKFVLIYSPLLLIVIIYYFNKGSILYDDYTKTKVEVD